MKTLPILLICALLSFYSTVKANAVLIVNAESKTVLQLQSSHVDATVTNQVAIVKSRQVFVNQLDTAVHVKYAFPLYEDASATGLRWKIGGIWYSAVFNPEPQDTTLPGGAAAVDENLKLYLGETPLYFDLEQMIDPDSTIEFELTYVQLLHYAYNEVSFTHPNNYSLIQTGAIDTQYLSIHVLSDRTIVGSNLLSHPAVLNTYTVTTADVVVERLSENPDTDYEYVYQLDPDELGLFSFSYFLPDSINYCDDFGRGYFGFIVEPDPVDSVIISKTFTLIIDRSGSMGEEKMGQAKEAATYIVNNLNAVDKFNIIDFDDAVVSLFEDHVTVNIATQNVALDYIDNLYASGSTNISGSFEMAIPQFESADEDEYNIIIFLTDGQATAGETSTDGILEIINNLITTNEVEGLSINTFGIGMDVNESLLSQIATLNNGVATFFAAGDLLEVVTDFYMMIQNPVLINTSMTFDPPIVSEVYPDPVPNLYLGHQLVVTGRYAVPGTVDVTFTGEKYGEVITYEYTFDLTDSTIEQNAFLTKLWAIDKINALMIEYFTIPDGTSEKDSMYQYITDLSICYSVISPFTSFSDNTGATSSIDEWQQNNSGIQIRNYPNPFTNETSINFYASARAGIVPLVIMDLEGRLIRILEVNITQAGEFKIIWDGKDAEGANVKAGTYPYYIQIGETRMFGVMQKF